MPAIIAATIIRPTTTRIIVKVAPNSSSLNEPPPSNTKSTKAKDERQNLIFIVFLFYDFNY